MKAIRFHEYGPPSVLRCEDIPMPTPGRGEVLVRVHATSVNPVDAAIRAGYLPTFSAPYTPGVDFSGAVEAVGEGATQWHPGDEVFGIPKLATGGCYAEYVAVPESFCARKPATLDHAHAAAIPLVALTAWQALFEQAGLTAGKTVLIQGGAGGVGTFAVQLARLRGIHVAATASWGNQALLRELGVEFPINYQTIRFEDALTERMDAVIDTVGGEIRRRSWDLLKHGAVLVALTGAPPTDVDAAALGIRQRTFWARADQTQLTEIARLVEAGELRPVIDSVLPLEQAALAHEKSEARHARGKIVLQVV